MRETRATQASLFDCYSQHKLGQELEAISMVLDNNLDLLAAVHNDLVSKETKAVGRRGLSAESVLRCIILKQRLKVSYEMLAFHLSDSASARAFARLGGNVIPKKSCLQASMRRVQASTLQCLNEQILIRSADNNLLSFEKIRVDSTVVLSNIVDPSDSQLLNDSIRVICRSLAKCHNQTGFNAIFQDQRKAAKSLAFRIFNAKKAEKDRLYPELLDIMASVLKQADCTLQQVKLLSDTARSKQWITQMKHFYQLACKVVDQTQRRVINGESVPSSQKIVSIFEEHTDIIVKGKRDVLFGHKINLSSQSNGFITHLTIEKGNTSDKNMHTPVIAYHQSTFGQTPKSMVTDGCYATQENARVAKEMGVSQVVFSKPVGLSLHDMGVKNKTFIDLKKFRAGVEANISEFKRAYAAGKATWKNLGGFQAYVWSSVLSYNLFKLVRLTM